MLTGIKCNFNGFELSDLVAVEAIRRTITADIQTRTSEVPGLAGLALQQVTHRGRYTEVDIRLIAKTEERLREIERELAGILHTTEAKQLRLGDDDVYQKAVLTGESWLEKFKTTARATLVFFSPDGLWYGEPQTQTFTRSATIDNVGTATAEVVYRIVINSVVTEVNLVNQTTGRFIVLDTTGLITGTTILVTCGDLDQSVRVNGELAMTRLSMLSDLEPLAVGANQVTVSAGVTVTAQWRPRFK